MAGDLLIVDISFNQKRIFEQAGATSGKEIFHSNKSWGNFYQVLEERLILEPPSKRKNLPAHAYITFNAANRDAVIKYCEDPIQKTRLNDVLIKCSRPLGIVTNNPNLKEWPGSTNPYSAILLTALEKGNVIIEYYKQDRSPIMDVFGNDSSWNKYQEQE